MHKDDIHPLQKAIGDAVERQRNKDLEEQTKKEVEIRTQIISAAYDRAATYTNLIIFAGYAGTFTLWSFTKDYLPETAAIAIALMVGISLFVFCGWEVYKMIYTSKSLRRKTLILLQGLHPAEFEKAMNNEKVKAENENIKLYRYWVFILVLTIPLGFGGALLMFYNYMANLIGLPYWPK